MKYIKSRYDTYKYNITSYTYILKIWKQIYMRQKYTNSVLF